MEKEKTEINNGLDTHPADKIEAGAMCIAPWVILAILAIINLVVIISAVLSGQQCGKGL